MINHSNNHLESAPPIKEKIIGTLSYGSLGVIGFVALLLKQAESRFLKYHIYQSIFLGILFMLLNFGLSQVLSLFNSFLFFAPQVQNIIMLGSSWGLLFLQAAEALIIIYSVITLWGNKYTWIKWVSAQIYKML